MNNNILVFTATFNEIENIEEFIKEVNKVNYKIDILIIDDNSPDGTGDLIDKIAKTSENLTLVRRGKKLGLDTAHKFAYNYAIKNDYTYLITLDADMSHEPKEINKILHQEQKKFNISLAGGDTTRSSKLIITIIVMGDTKNKPVLRKNCKLNDDIYVTGNIGDSFLGLNILKKRLSFGKFNNFLKKKIL